MDTELVAAGRRSLTGGFRRGRRAADPPSGAPRACRGPYRGPYLGPCGSPRALGLSKTRDAADSKLGMETTPRSSVGPTPQAPVSSPVLEWRRRRLVASGFDEALAAQVASSRIDLHELLALLDAGCPPHLAVRILAPIERPLLPDLGAGMCSPVSPWPPGSTVNGH